MVKIDTLQPFCWATAMGLSEVKLYLIEGTRVYTKGRAAYLIFLCSIAYLPLWLQLYQSIHVGHNFW